jgi:hypothetical protein
MMFSAHCREEFKGPYSKEVCRALKHIKSAVIQYGAHYGIVICIGYDDGVWYGSTRNMGLEAVQMHNMVPMLEEHLRMFVPKNTLIMREYHRICRIEGRGHKETAKGNTFGIRNKVTGFATCSSNLAREDPAGRFPVIALFSSKNQKHYFIHPNPDDHPKMKEVEVQMINALSASETKIPLNLCPIGWHRGERKAACHTAKKIRLDTRSHLKWVGPQKVPRGFSDVAAGAVRKVELREGTWQWYQSIARSASFALGRPLVYDGSMYAWAFSDAKRATEGRQLNIDRNMLVTVKSVNASTVQCSCKIFRNHGKCVHAEYSRENYESLVRQIFHDPRHTFEVTKNDGKSHACYYCDGSLVRIVSQTASRVRFQCHTHQSSYCEHVRKVYEKFHRGKLCQDVTCQDQEEEK